MQACTLLQKTNPMCKCFQKLKILAKLDQNGDFRALQPDSHSNHPRGTTFQKQYQTLLTEKFCHSDDWAIGARATSAELPAYNEQAPPCKNLQNRERIDFFFL